MFNGIIRQLATVTTIAPGKGGIRLALQLHHNGTMDNPVEFQPGNSYAVQGACLTLTNLDQYLWFDVSKATLKVTTLGHLKAGDLVNLEPAMQLGGNIDGHLVSGHIDGTGEIAQITPLGDNYQLRIAFPMALRPYIAKKGSMCVDGVSLTVNEANDRSFTVNIIPFTWQHTRFSGCAVGDRVNLEVDMLARYTVHALKIFENIDK